MYLPYLKDQQFELQALEMFARLNPNCESIIPIIEPIRRNNKAINSAFNTLGTNHMKFSVILNPTEGAFRNGFNNNDIVELCPSLLSMKDAWIPAYSYSGNGDSILKHAYQKDLHDIMVVFPEGEDLENPELRKLITNYNVKYVIVTNASRATKSKFMKFGKNVITLEDRLKASRNNFDYASVEDEFFSDDFAFYKEEGLWGYSDYATIGKEVNGDGTLPYTLAIHLTYQKSEEEINVHHFVSDNNFDQSGLQDKFIEAAKKISPFFQERNLIKTSAVQEFIVRANETGGYPGLGNLRKLSLLNHLEMIFRLSNYTSCTK